MAFIRDVDVYDVYVLISIKAIAANETYSGSTFYKKANLCKD